MWLYLTFDPTIDKCYENQPIPESRLKYKRYSFKFKLLLYCNLSLLGYTLKQSPRNHHSSICAIQTVFYFSFPFFFLS